MASIHALPIELIADIFQRALSSPKQSRDPRDITRLSHVCSHWREIVQSSPKLWDRLRLVWSEAFTDWSYDQHTARKCMTQHALAQSQDLPLTLEIHAEHIPDNDVVCDIIQSILPVASRVQHLRLSLSLPEHMGIGFLFPAGGVEVSFPLLESLHLRIWSEREDRVKYRPNVFSNSPNLRSLTIEQGFTRVAFDEAAFLWSKLEHIAVRAILSTRQYHALLRWCTNLYSAALTVRVHGSFQSGSEKPCPSKLTHPTLSELHLSVADARGNISLGDVLLDSLTLPALTSFSCRKICDPDLYSPLNAFNALLRRSACPLTKLKIDFDDVCCPTRVRDLVDCTPNLTDLNVTIPIRRAADFFSGFLIVRHPDLDALPRLLPTAWPRLKSLTMDASNDIEPAALLELLDKRAAGLDSLHIEYRQDADIQSRVEELQAQGFNVSLEEKDDLYDDSILNVQ